MRASPDQYRYVTEKTSPVAPTKAHPQSASNPARTVEEGGMEAVFALSLSLFSFVIMSAAVQSVL